jgi:molybdopterin-guanine dinucleotide biosynthesis protein A
MSLNDQNIAVVLLAGGEARRLGGNKPLRVIGGHTLLDRALAIARCWPVPIAVAVRREGQLGAMEVTELIDDPAIEGPLGGLASALRFAAAEGRDAVLTLPCDMPFAPNDLLDRLAVAIGVDQGAAIACSEGNLHPVCGLWRVTALDVLPDYLASGQRSLRGFAALIHYAAVTWNAEPQDPFFNINNEGDLEVAEQLLGA